MIMKKVYMVASGDLRESANQMCWPAQEAMEKQVIAAVEREGWTVERAHPCDPAKKHGFLDSQKYGIEVFRSIPAKAPVIVAEAVWQYTHHVLPGLMTHRGPILTVANWSGTWPGLVGMLNLNGSLTKAGVPYSSLWSEDFTDDFFVQGLRKWLKTGSVKTDTSHVTPSARKPIPAASAKIGVQLAREFRTGKAIMGIFDEGCMGMHNAIIPDELLSAVGVFKERLSQSALYARMQTIGDDEAREVYKWLQDKGMKFVLGRDEAADLTEQQVLTQCKMYIAAVRIADDFGCDTIGIQYQQGLKDLTPASDLVEGILNNSDRPPVYHESTGQELYAGKPLPHFNEVDECAGLDALITNRVWTRLGLDPETTLHDVRWGRKLKLNGKNEFVWILEISGAVPPAHLDGGYKGATSERQPAMYFPKGGGTVKGLSKPGEVVWSRVFVQDNKLHCDLGLGKAVAVPDEFAAENWKLTTSQWPMMHLVMKGVTRDQFMARHKANHIQVAYARDAASARKALYAKAAFMKELGIPVSYCGRI
jgi:L-fucose isomerase-like protein